MSIKISGAPCSWGVDDVRNPHLPKWTRVLDEASQAGYQGIELGPYGFMPLDAGVVDAELRKQGLNIVAGTIFDDLVSEAAELLGVHDVGRIGAAGARRAATS